VFDGYYGSSKVLVEQVNAAYNISTNDLHELMTLHPITQKVKIFCPEDSLVVFSPVLASMLGLQTQTYEQGVHEGDQVVDIHRGFYSLYMYCDAIEPRIVGDTLAPLLKVLPIKGEHGDIISLTYPNIQFHPIKCTEISDIEIDIRKDTGKSVAFQRGKVVATLAIRRKPLSVL